MPNSDTSPSGRSMTALDILSSCAMALSGEADAIDAIGGHSAVTQKSEMPMPPAVVSPTTPGVSPVSPSTMTAEVASGENATIAATAAKPSDQRQKGSPPFQKKMLVRAREVSACSDDSAKDTTTLDTDDHAIAAASSSGTLSSRIGDVTQPITQRLRSSMEQSRKSLKQLQEWDRRLGLPKSSAHTCVKTERSRKQLLEGKILKKWDGTPLISEYRSHSSILHYVHKCDWMMVSQILLLSSRSQISNILLTCTSLQASRKTQMGQYSSKRGTNPSSAIRRGRRRIVATNRVKTRLKKKKRPLQ